MSGPAFAECPPDKPALIFGLSGLEVTYGDLEARANQRAHALRELGLKAGDVLAICIQNSPEFFDVACAARRSGLVTVPISTQLTAAEVAFITADSGCKALVVSAGIDADKAKLRALCKGVALLAWAMPQRLGLRGTNCARASLRQRSKMPPKGARCLLLRHDRATEGHPLSRRRRCTVSLDCDFPEGA